MAERGAPVGNQNATKEQRMVTAALKRAATQDPDKVRKACEKILDMAVEGNLAAFSIIADRLDGKAVQAVEGFIEHDHTGTVTHDHKSGMDFEKIMEERQKLRLVK